MAEAAARAGDNIHHTSALAGFIVGSIIGAALIASVAFATFTCGFGAALLAGMFAGFAANGIRDLAERVGSKCKSTTGKILQVGCSNNVFINGRQAAKAIVSNAECAKDMPMAPVAEGSSNVFINQNAAARKNDKIQCGATISEGSDNVIIGGGKVQYLPVKDEVPDWVRKASDILFVVAGIAGGAAGAFQKAGGVLSKCALKFVAGFVAGEVASNYISDKAMEYIGGLFGNPVDVTNGQKVLFDERELDFIISARLPIYWQRYYSSELNEGVLGKGWRLDFEVSLRRNGEELIHTGRTGQQTVFPRLGTGEYSYCSESQIYFYCMTDGRHVVRTLDDIYYVYPEFKDRDVVGPEHIEDSDHNFIRFHYDEQNAEKLVGISDSQDHKLICNWHPTLARLISVEQLKKNGTRQVMVRYDYDEKGNLSAVYDTAGTRTRRFVYNENALMTEQTDVNGMQCFYRWHLVEKEKWCVAESRNSEGEQAHYSYDFTKRQSSVIDERGLRATWAFNEKQQVTFFEDFSQDIYRVEYNSEGMPVLFHLPGERRITIERDGLNRIIEETDPLGRMTSTDYYLNTLKVVRKVFPDGSIWQADYDEKGHLLIATDPLKHQTKYSYDKTGLPIQIVDAKGGKKELKWDENANLLQYTDCSGKSIYYAWDESGSLISTTNMHGEVTQFIYNKLQELKAVHYPDNSSEHFTYFSSGLLRCHTDTAGKKREWRYNRRGQPVQYTDRLNRQLHYWYDARGHLYRLMNGNGGEYKFSYDVNGSLVEELRPDKTRHLIEYDTSGYPVRERWLGCGHTERNTVSREFDCQYDKGGRMIARGNGTASFSYSYDAADRLTKLRRTPTRQGEVNGIVENLLTFSWDKRGQMLEESCDGDKIRYQWSPTGELTELSLPNNNTLHWLSYGAGHVSAIRHNNQLVTEFERDDLHRETQRTQGGLTQRRGYDSRGRRAWQRAFTAEALNENADIKQQAKLWRTYHFDQAGELTRTNDAFRGTQHYLFDAESRLLSYETPQPDKGVETFNYDDADNIFGLPEIDWANFHNGRPDSFRTNRLPVWCGTGFRYDGFGNMVQRTQGSQTQNFVYDDENRLVRASGDGPEGRYEAQYRYDGLGRRMEKRVTYQGEIEERVTRFRWQGLRLIQEISPKHVRSYIYDPNENWAPLARITQSENGQQTDYFHTDLNGTPLELTSSEGNIIWCGRYSAWGKLKPQVHLEEDNSGLSHQPLRYPGQYHDDETGLHYNTFRYYDPEVGRFTTQDPVGLTGGINLYQYAPNPLSYIDPLGLSSYDPLAELIERGYTGVIRTTGGGLDYSGSNALYNKIPGINPIVPIEYTGDYDLDFRAANRAAGLEQVTTPRGYVWHHLDDFDPSTNRGTMQLVEKNAHLGINHNGGVSQYKAATGNAYTHPARARGGSTC